MMNAHSYNDSYNDAISAIKTSMKDGEKFIGYGFVVVVVGRKLFYRWNRAIAENMVYWFNEIDENGNLLSPAWTVISEGALAWLTIDALIEGAKEYDRKICEAGSGVKKQKSVAVA